MGEINERDAFLPIEGWRNWDLEAILVEAPRTACFMRQGTLSYSWRYRRADLTRVEVEEPSLCPDEGHRLLGEIQLQSASSSSHIERSTAASTRFF